MHQMCEDGKIPATNLRRVGNPKPIFLVLHLYVLGLEAERKEAAERHAEKLVEKDRSRTRRKAANRPQLEFLTDQS